MNWKTPAHNRAKAVIASAAAHGAGIDYLPDAPRFRFVPNGPAARDSGKPSTRGQFSYPNRLKLKNWRPTPLSLAPQYDVAMAGDDYALTDARRAWAKGNPVPLRKWLAAQRPAELKLAA